MKFKKTCLTCGKDKPFSYYQPLDPNIRTINKGSRPMNRKFNPEDLEDICKPCQEKRVCRFERAEDHIQGDYIFELGAASTELTSEDLEWWTLPEEEAHQFSMPQRKEWFKCKGCSEVFPKAAKYRNRYKYCEPCGVEYNRKKRMLSYYREKEIDNSTSKDAVSNTGSED